MATAVNIMLNMICTEHLKHCNPNLPMECASNNTSFIFLIRDLYGNNCLLIMEIKLP
jgi:hypothetical protein